MQLTPDEPDRLKVEFLLSEYTALWSYYTKTLDERARSFSSYLQIVGIPSAILVGFAAIDPTDDSASSTPTTFDTSVVGYLLAAVFLIGLASFLAHTLEWRNSRRYLRNLKKIRNYVSEQYSDLASVLTLDKDRKERFPEIPDITSIAFYRDLVIVLLNSVVAAASFATISGELAHAALAGVFIISVAAQIMIGVLVSSARIDPQ